MNFNDPSTLFSGFTKVYKQMTNNTANLVFNKLRNNNISPISTKIYHL